MGKPLHYTANSHLKSVANSKKSGKINVSMLAFTATRLYTPLQYMERPVVLVEGESVVDIFSQAERPVPQGSRLIDFGDAILAPGFVDIHIHGGAGHDVMHADTKGFAALERLLAAHGVTSYFPTTVTAPIAQTLAALDRLATAIEQAEQERSGDGHRAQPAGIHLEGPFISHIRRGVHPPAHLQQPSLDLFDRFWQAARGRIRLMTIAPELEGAMEVIAEAARRGVCVSLGHTDADLDTAHAAVAAGARHATHTFNAMRPLNHRDAGILGAVLTDARLSADIIADGIHLHPVIVDLFVKAKGPDLAVLITDATAATGMPEGRYRLGDMDVEVKDGRCMAEGKLAGSVLTMDRAVRNVMQFAHWNLQDALRLATLNPARITGLTRRGKLEPGCVADIAILNSRGEVKTTIVRGAVPDAAAKA
ncbi:MAG TPA: N-acetylglucosamine-6-phosphate deacetylase [Terriglobales bacterium]|nr:N-acetylglucosamine-6-phosphate deacetylase [Terriglobales bacterium]